MSYQVKLEVFEGPFDLLLQLIARRRIEVTEVDLAEITADFLASLPDIEQLDLETATQFLVVASALIQIKAARLLPSDDDELDDLASQTRDVLYARLLEYRAFRDAGVWLGERAEDARGFVARDQPLEPRFRELVPDADLRTSAEELAGLAAAALASRPPQRIDRGHVRRAYMSVQHAAQEILTRVPSAGASTTFRSLVDGRGSGDRVVFFLSLLELYKLGELDLQQPVWDGELAVRRRDTQSTLDPLEALPDDTRESPGAASAATAGSQGAN